MAEIVLLGTVEDLGFGSVATAAQARALERQLMTPAKPTSFLSQLATGMDAGAGQIASLGDQAVQVLDAATRLKIATKAAKVRVKQSIAVYKNPIPVTPEPSWPEGEMIPGLKNTHALLLAAALLGGVLLLRRS